MAGMLNIKRKSRNRKLIMFLISHFIFHISFSQKSDSLKKALLTAPDDTNKVLGLSALSREAANLGNYPLADSLAQAELKLAEKLQYKKGMAKALSDLALLNDYLGENDQALGNYTKALKIYRET